MMKKILALLLALVLVVGLTACTASKQPEPTTAPTEAPVATEAPAEETATEVTEEVTEETTEETVEVAYDGSPVTIKFYHTMGASLTAVLDAYIAEFNAIYPNITVEYTSVGSYDDVRDQISTEITVGAQPNIAYCYPDHVAMYNLAQVVQTLDSYIDSAAVAVTADGSYAPVGLSAEQKADFIEGYYNEGKQFGDGLMYTMPLSKSTEVLYYNKTFFEANNLTLPTTWEEMEKVCAAIKAIDPNSIPLGYDSESNWFITMCEQYQSPYTSATGDHFLFNNEQNRAFMKMFHGWMQKGYVTTQTLYGAYTSGLFTSTTEVKSYMSIGSSAGANYQRPTAVDGVYPFEVGIATIPQVNVDAPKVISQGPSVCVFKKADATEVAASWLFVKFLTTSVEFQAEFSIQSGYVPVLKSVADHPVYADRLAKADGGDNVSMLSAKVCLEQADAYYTSPAFNGSSVARTQVGTLITTVLTLPDDANLDAAIEDAFQNAIDECEYAF